MAAVADPVFQYSWLIPVLTAAAFALVLFLGQRLPGKGGPVALLLTAAAGALSLAVAWKVWQTPIHFTHPYVRSVEWFSAGDLSISFGVYIDNLTAVMLFVVGILTTLIVLYSQAYMKEEGASRPRYYAEITLFITGMLGLVLSSNFLELFVFWEIMGLCSYLLIGYWYTKPSAAHAATKAFLTTRVGDLFFFAGLAILFLQFGSLDFTVVFDEANIAAADRGLLAVAMLCVFAGAVGKSAQIPLHVWLPDAMEGPTTVSALIHAATMVKAGVYLIARSYPLLVQVPIVLLVVAIVGGLTAFIAATMALFNNDLKRVLAFSTISQLGYMFLALGAGALALAGYSFGVYHLMNHAFFKALLFLAAGSVGHALHNYDMREMGGLLKKMPITGWTMLIASLSIAGIFPFSGFFSKDELLAAVRHAGEEAVHNGLLPAWAPDAFTALYWLGILTALMTAFYMFRLWFMTFAGTYRGEHEDHIHESPAAMTSVLVILALFTIGGGAFMFAGPEGLAGFVHAPVEGFHPHTPALAEMLLSPFTWLSLAAGVAGILVALLQYRPDAVGGSIRADDEYHGLRKFLYRRWYWDDLYYWFTGTIVLGVATVIDWLDRYVIDGVVNGVGALNMWTGERVRKWQTGNVSDYALAVVAGVVLIILAVIYAPQAVAFLDSRGLLIGGI